MVDWLCGWLVLQASGESFLIDVFQGSIRHAIDKRRRTLVIAEDMKVRDWTDPSPTKVNRFPFVNGLGCSEWNYRTGVATHDRYASRLVVISSRFNNRSLSRCQATQNNLTYILNIIFYLTCHEEFSRQTKIFSITETTPKRHKIQTTPAMRSQQTISTKYFTFVSFAPFSRQQIRLLLASFWN